MFCEDDSIVTEYRTIDELSAVGKFTDYKDPDRILYTDSQIIKTFQSNPYVDSGDDVAQIVGVTGKRIIGGVGSLRLRIVADKCSYVATANVDTFVNPDYRKSCYAIDLMSISINIPKDRCAVNFNISPVARKVAKLMGRAIFLVRQFVVVRRSRFFLMGRLPKFFTFLACPLLDVVFWLNRIVVGVVVKLKMMGYRLQEVGVESVAEFAEMIAEDKHRFRQHMGVEWFKWMLNNDFQDQENSRKRIFRIEWEGERVGFILVRNSNHGKRGRLIEWQFEEKYESKTPWLLLMAALKIKDADATVIAIDKTDVRSLKVLGRILMHIPDQCAGVGAGTKSPLKRHEGWKEAKNWRIRPALGDAAFY